MLTPKEIRGREDRVYPVEIEHSALFDGVDDYLSFTPSAGGNRKTWALRTGIKFAGTDPARILFTANADATNNDRATLAIFPDRKLYFFGSVGGVTQFDIVTEAIFSDETGHYDLTLSVDTTQATPADRVRVEVNGILLTSFSPSTYPAQYADLQINNAVTHHIAANLYSGSSQNYFGGYLSDLYFIDGQALPASTWGEFSDQVTGLWIPNAEVEIPEKEIVTATTLIPFNEGVSYVDPNLDFRGYKDRAFDGVTNYTYQTGPQRVGGGTSVASKDWGAGNEKAIGELRVHSNSNSGLSSGSPDIYLEGSDDGSTWTQLGHLVVSNGTIAGAVHTVSAANQNTLYRHHRCRITTSADLQFSEIQFYENSFEIMTYGTNGCHLDFADADNLGNDVVLPPTKFIIGSTNAFTGGTAYGPSNYGLVPANLFDANNGSPRWDADSATGTDCFAAYQLSTAKTIGAYLVRTYDGSGATAWAYGWDILGSNDSTNGADGTWDLLDSVRNQTQMAAYGASYNGTIDSPGEYVWYKWVFQGGDHSFVNSLGTWHGYEVEGYTSPNSWTVNGSPVQTVDSPTDNYATLNPLTAQDSFDTLSNGNLTASDASFAGNGYSTLLLPRAGKFVFEGVVDSQTGTSNWIGVRSVDEETSGGAGTHRILYRADGQKDVDGVVSAYAAPYGANDTIRCEFDIDNSSLEFFKNNVSQGAIVDAGLGSTISELAFNVTSVNGGWTAAFGATGFTHAPSAGFKALSSANLPDPAILKSSTVADVVLRTGLGANPSFNYFFTTNGSGRTVSKGSAVYDHAMTDKFMNQTGDKVYWECQFDIPSYSAYGAGRDGFLFTGQPHGGGLSDNAVSCYNGWHGQYGVALGGSPVASDNQRLGFAYDPTTHQFHVCTGGTIQKTYTLSSHDHGFYFGVNGTAGSATVYGDPSDFSHPIPAGYDAIGPNQPATVILPDMEGGPNFLWSKSRTNTYYHHIHDSVRGPNLTLRLDSANANVPTPQGLMVIGGGSYSFGSDAGVNEVGQSFVDLALKAGVAQGFEIVPYTGTGGVLTVPHNLGKAPTFMIVKRIDSAENWYVYHKTLGAGQALQFTSGVAFPTIYVWDDTEPTSTHFTVGDTTTNLLNGEFVAYLFTDSDMFKAFSYTGNGSADGPFVNLGGRPLAIPFLKNADRATADWRNFDSMRDPFNGMRETLYPNENWPELTAGADILRFTSTGFKNSINDTNTNGVGDLHVGLAILESTSKYVNAY